MRTWIALLMSVSLLALPLTAAGVCDFKVDWESKTHVGIAVGDMTAAKLDVAGSTCVAETLGATLRLNAACVAQAILAQSDPKTGAPLTLQVADPTKLPDESKACLTAGTTKVSLRALVEVIPDAVVQATGQSPTFSASARVSTWNAFFDGKAWQDLPFDEGKKTAQLLAMPPWKLVAGNKAMALLDIAGPPSCDATPSFDAAKNRFIVPLAELDQLAPLAADVSAAHCSPVFGSAAIEYDRACLGEKLQLAGGKPLALSVGTPKPGAVFTHAKGCSKGSTVELNLAVPKKEIAIREDDTRTPQLSEKAAIVKEWPWIWVKPDWVKLETQANAAAVARGALARAEGGALAFLVPAPAAPPEVSNVCAPSYTVKRQPVERRVAPGRFVQLQRELKSIDWCPDAPGSELFCIDLACGSPDLVLSPSRNVLQPNRGVVVRVRHAAGHTVKVTLGGKRGLEELGIGKPGIKSQSGPAPTPLETRVSSFPFVPRKPGPADLTITLEKEGGSSETRTLELEVESLTWGAARFGFAALFGNAVARTYEVQTFAGSNQQEIAVKGNTDMGWEAVIGLAPYLIDIFACPGHGRSHTGGCNYRIAPYLGIGIIGQAPNGVSSFNSFHAGAEIELASSFSIATTAVWRTVDALRPGYSEGAPVQAGTSFTQSITETGFGVVLNVSPDFLQFATGTGGKEAVSQGSAATTPAAPATTSTPEGDGK